MDVVYIHSLKIDTQIGIHDWEKRTRQTVILNLELGSDIARAAASDRISDALDYEAVTARLRDFVTTSRFDLVETLAERCATLLRDEFGVSWMRLTIDKPGALGDDIQVGVRIERGDPDGHAKRP